MPAKVVIAPDSFKGSLSARFAADAIAAGWRSVRSRDRLTLAPQADGGEGTLDAMEASAPGSVRQLVGPVTGPDGSPVPGEWLRLPDGTAVIELAQMSGLPLMPAADALGATTRGLGEVILHARLAGAPAIVVGLGGSASTDGGSGALAALGLHLLDRQGRAIGDGGRALADLVTVDYAGLIAPPPNGLLLLTDVTAPLTGESGAAAIFSPQKGATPESVIELDAALTRFAQVLGGHPTAAGAGAAGGTAYGLATALQGRILPGADYLAELTGLERQLAHADLLITGEGRFDAQSLGGKVVGQLLSRAARHGVPVAVVAGQLDADPGCWATSLSDLAGSADAAISDPRTWLYEAGARAARDHDGIL